MMYRKLLYQGNSYEPLLRKFVSKTDYKLAMSKNAFKMITQLNSLDCVL